MVQARRGSQSLTAQKEGRNLSSVAAAIFFYDVIVTEVLLLLLLLKVKVKFTLEQATKVQRGSRGFALLFFCFGTRWGGWSTPRPGRFTPVKKTRYLFYRRLGGPQARSERMRKI